MLWYYMSNDSSVEASTDADSLDVSSNPSSKPEFSVKEAIVMKS